MISESKGKAAANPTKEFFVRMITRDITLEDCILDLIDNSVDGAWRSEGSRPMGLAEGADLSKYSISIVAGADRFDIEDNCGGMTLDDAINHAFSFGRHIEDGHDNYSIGVYGIGMKRAVFKLGSDITIRSTYDTDAGVRESFLVPINVNEWVAKSTPPWDFDINNDEPLSSPGVKISIESLTAGAKQSFGSPAFIQELRRTIARDYTLHLNRGLEISLNGTLITNWPIELRRSDEFVPMRMEYTDEIDGNSVSVEILAGMAAPPPDTSEPDNEDEGDKRFGWYVVCNGRIVLAADKTTISGWGSDDWPQWHRQYSGFMGIILFTAENAAALPLTTTKRSVDISSEIFRHARPQMREVTKKWIAYTNQRKQSLEEAKAREAAAAPIRIYEVAKRATVSLPRLTSIAPATPSPANVAYTVPVARLKKLAKEFGSINMSYREVGIKSFEYSFKDLVGEE